MRKNKQLLKTIALMKELKGLGRRIGVLSNMSREFFAGYFCGAAAPIRALLDGDGLCEAALLPDALRETLEQLGGQARTERDEDGLHLTCTLPAGRAPFAVKEAELS